MRDSSGGKAIKITPDDLIFDQVIINQTYTQQLTLKNSLSAPVDITLKSSNQDRLDIEPKVKKLAPFESCVIDVIVKVTKPFPAKTQKQKETIFLKSDFFDQKVNVTIIPGANLGQSQGVSARDSSLGSSTRINNLKESSGMVPRLNIKRDISKESNFRNQQFGSKEYSPKQSSFQNNMMPGLERELELKSTQLMNLTEQLEKQEHEAQQTLQQLNVEMQKRKELEEKLYDRGGNSNKEYLDEVRILLREREPNLEQLMELTLKKERGQQERKDAKILDILRLKDKQMEEFQQKAMSYEAENEKLAQLLQESQRKIKQIMDENDQQKAKILDMSVQLEKQQSYINSYETTESSDRLKQIETQYNQANSMIRQLQEQAWQSEQALNEKSQNEAFYNEAIDRQKSQLQQKEAQIQQFEKEIINFKEDRIRYEEQSKQLKSQIAQMAQESHNERNQNVQKLKSEHDILERINKLQNDKSELLNVVEQLKAHSSKDQDQLRFIMERIASIKGLGLLTSSSDINMPLIDQLERKVEDMARFIREQNETNMDLNNKLQRLNSSQKNAEQELQLLLEENEHLQQKLQQSKKKVNSTQTQVDMHEIQDMLTNFDTHKNRAVELEQQVTQLNKDIGQYQQKIRSLQNELDKQNQELKVIIRTQQQQPSQYNIQNSTLYGSSSVVQGENTDEIISKLNAKITTMKLNEEKLTQQLNQMSTQQLLQDSDSQLQQKQYHFQSSINIVQPQKLIGLEERLGEYEIILMQQKEQLIKLEEHNSQLNQEIIQLQRSKENELEQFQLRIKNLSELNRKHEQLSTNRDTRMSIDTNLGFSVSAKSTAADTEKLRQYAQQMELNNMSLKHQIESFQVERDQAVNQCQELKNELSQYQKQVIKLKQESRLAQIGLGDSDQYVNKISEQKNKIKQLEGLLLRAKQDFDKIGQNTHTNKNNGKFEWAGQRLEDVLKTNEFLRHEHQRVVSALVDIKEEYTNKLEQFSNNYEAQRQKLKLENMNLTRKCETLTSQILYMEKKELRLFGQLEEIKAQQFQDNNEKEQCLKDLGELVIQKDETINELEREVKQKDRSLKERQDQISVLIETLENEHTADELRQRVLNLSAELCSLKSIEAQQERRSNELFHQLKMFEQTHQKNNKLVEQLKVNKKEMQDVLDKQNNEIYDLQSKNQELSMNNNDLQKECNDLKYKVERQDLQFNLKEDTIQQLREYSKKTEIQFKEQMNRLRKEFTEKSNVATQNKDLVRTLNFKQAVQQLHLVLVDYLKQGILPVEQILAQDFEKTLIVASQTIENLQINLDKHTLVNLLLKNEYSTLTHNQVLVSKQELLANKIQGLELSFNKREDERWAYQKQTEQAYTKIIKDQEAKIIYYEKQYNDMSSQNTQLTQQLNEIKIQKEDLEVSLVCFQQEVDNQKMAFERKAELIVDERYKSKHEAIRSYFDSNITKILLSQGTSNKFLELGREICSLKIVIQNLENRLLAEQTDRDTLEQNQQRLKIQTQQHEYKIREQQSKIRNYQNSQQSKENQIKIQVEKKNQEALQLEKELIKAKETIEEKARIINQIQNKSSLEVSPKNFNKIDKFDVINQKDRLNTAFKDISDLQEQIVGLRAQHIQEIENYRIQYDIDLAEARRSLNEEKVQMEKRYKPGQAPGDLLEKNEILKNKVQEMRQALDNITQESIILRKKAESEKMNALDNYKELQVHKQILQDLEQELVVTNQTQSLTNFNTNLNQSQIQLTQRNEQPKRNSSKGASSHKKNVQLQFNRDNTYNQSIDQLQQSKLQDSSLNVSDMTTLNAINPRNSQSLMAGSFQGVSGQGTQKQFLINPPAIIKALIQSKMAEAKSTNKVLELIQQETNLRNNLKTLTIQLRELESVNRNKNTQNKDCDSQSNVYYQKLLELEIENEDLKIAIAQSQVQSIRESQGSQINEIKEIQNIESPMYDYSILVEAILSLSNQLVKQEIFNNSNDQQNSLTIEQAQRIVIKSLADRLFVGKSQIDLQYIPTQEQDRKIWYLELLEQQLESSDQSIKTLQNFIKKLQIEISGNLQSAAQIKASSMDLAQNTKKTSEEIKSVGQIIGLIKHDIRGLMNKDTKQQQYQQSMSQTAVNPFLDIIDPSITQRKNRPIQNEGLIQANESLQNQLTITEKVKKTLEQEIVSLKISHAQELQQLTNQLQMTGDQRDSLLQNNEELHEKVLNLEQHLETLKSEINNLNMSYENNQVILNEKEKERDTLAKTKNATSKHLQKLQQDLSDWRRQTDENMKIKEKQVTDLTATNLAMTQERDKLKSENQMLRRNQKDLIKGESEELKKLEQENKELVDNLNKEMESRKKEIQYWITERATMKEMIDQLESDKAGVDIKQEEILGSTEEQLKQIKKKSIKKLKVKDAEVKQKDKQVQDLIAEIQKLKMASIQQDQKLRELTTQLTESDEKARYYSQRLKEIELEKDLVLAEKNNAISTNDYTAQQIQVELNSLRECFSKLKVERDSLLSDIDQTHQNEQEWKNMIEQLNQEIKKLENQMVNKETDQGAQIRTLEQKNSILLQDVKYLRLENEKIKQRIRDADQLVLDQQTLINEENKKMSEQQYLNEQLQIKIQNIQQSLNRSSQHVQDLEGQIVLIEGSKFKDIEQLREKLQDLKDSHSQVISLYEAQLEQLKTKLIYDKKLTDQKSDQILTLAQREAVIKNLKKENLQLKSQVSKAKTQNEELKQQINIKSENISQNQGKGAKSISNKTSKQSTATISQEDNMQEKAVLKIAEMLSSNEGFKGMLEQLQKTNDLVYKIVEYESNVAKMENQFKIVNHQLQQQQDINNQITQQLEEFNKKDLNQSKNVRQSQAQLENTKQYKQEIKSLQAEIRQIKEEWLSPEDFRALQEQLKDQSAQIKAAKDEVQRKRDVINTMKQQRDQTENESNQIMQDMEGLKDDNSKQQKLLKEHTRNLIVMKELKQNNDFLKAQEKRLKDEVNSLNEKLKLTKIDLQRKEQILKDHKDKLDSIQDEVNISRDRQNEVEKLRDQVKKNKLEIEIKDNQVRAIRQKLEHTEVEYEQLKSQAQSNIMSSQNNQSQLDQQVKTSKLKLKKYEAHLRRSLEALRKIGKQLTTHQYNSKSTVKKKQKQANDNPLMISELDRDLYKDSVNILGVSMDELAEFMNPGIGNINHSAHSDNRHNDSSMFLAKLDRALEFPDTLNTDIDQICDYCVKLINEIGAENSGFV